MTTKEQERKALDKIRKIVEDLGPDSYLSYAFEGVYEVAEENIRDDAAYSLKARALDAEHRADRAEAQVNEVKAAQRKEIADLKHECEVLKLQNEALAHRVEALFNQKAEAEKKALPESLKNTVIARLEKVAETARKNMAQCAEEMSDFAECPQDIGFVDAAKWYKIHRNEATRTEDLIEKLKNF